MTKDNTFHYSIPVVPRAATDTQGREYFEFEISNETRDLHGTIFRMDGGRIDEYNADPAVTYGHPSFDSTDPDDVIGTSEVVRDGNKLIARFYPEPGETNVKTAKVVNKLRSGVIKSCSIVAGIYAEHRGIAAKGENPKTIYYDDWELLGWGIVAKGSNPKAKMRTAERAAAFHAAHPEIDDQTPPPHDDQYDQLRLMESLSRSMNVLSECR